MSKKNINIGSKQKEMLIERFCEHLRNGFSEYSFVECDYRDIEKFALELDERKKGESQVEKIKKALRESFCYWEKLAFSILNGEKKYFFPMWSFYVKSRFHWGIEDSKHTKKQKKENINLIENPPVKQIEK